MYVYLCQMLLHATACAASPYHHWGEISRFQFSFEAEQVEYLEDIQMANGMANV